MSYPRVEVDGAGLPEPFDGWDEREQVSDDQTEAVYYPTRFKVMDQGYLHMAWESEEEEELAWINKDNIDNFTVTYE